MREFHLLRRREGEARDFDGPGSHKPWHTFAEYARMLTQEVPLPVRVIDNFDILVVDDGDER